MQQRERGKGGRKEREEERKDFYHLNDVLYVYFTIAREYKIPGYKIDKIKETDNLVLVRMQQDLNLSDFGGGINQLFFFFFFARSQFPYQGSNPGPQQSKCRVLTTGSLLVVRVRFLLGQVPPGSNWVRNSQYNFSEGEP